MATQSSRQFTIPLSSSDECEGIFRILGTQTEVETIMSKLQQFVRNELHVQRLENIVPETSKPSPCAGCGN